MVENLKFEKFETCPDVMPATVKLPEFWPLKAALWFARADAEFSTKGVTAESTKYSYVVAALPVEVADRVTDEILSPDDTTPYTNCVRGCWIHIHLMHIRGLAVCWTCLLGAVRSRQHCWMQCWPICLMV